MSEAVGQRLMHLRGRIEAARQITLVISAENDRLHALNKELVEALEQVLDLCEGETNADMLAIIIPVRDVLSRAKDS